MNSKYLIICISVLLVSCNSPIIKDESSPFYAVEVGSSMILNQPLIMPPNRASILLQYGKVVPSNNVNIYYANCSFEINTLSESSVTIHPDTFLIYRVIDETISVSLQPNMYASLGMLADGGGSDFNYTTTMYLESKQQPDVLRLACMHWESTEDNNYLTIEQMRQALGDIITIELKN